MIDSTAQSRPGLVDAQRAGQAHQDRGTAGAARQEDGVPVGRGGRAASAVPRGAGTQWQAMPGAWLSEDGAGELEERGPLGVVCPGTGARGFRSRPR